MAILPGYIGTYTVPQSRGIYRFAFNAETGALGEAELFYEAHDPKCVAVQDGLLAAPVQREDRAGLVLLNTHAPDAPFRGELCCERATACFIAIDAPYLYTANYHEGLVLVYRHGERLELVRRIEIGREAGCHQVMLHEQYLMVPCLERDEVLLFDASHNYKQAGAIAFPQGSGPRHGVFDHAHKHLYMVTERSHELYVFAAAKNGTFIQKGASPIIDLNNPAQFQGATTAAVRLSPDERFLYISTRGTDCITVFALAEGIATRIQQLSCGGQHPRDMILSPDGRFALVLNRFSNNLVSFARDRQTGLLGAPVGEITVYEGSGIALDDKMQTGGMI